MEKIEKDKNIDIPSLRIKEIKFNDNTEIELENDDIILFVGANNVGKSRTLKDIKDDLIQENLNNKIIISDIKYNSNNFNKDSIKKFLERNFRFDKDNNENYSIPVEYNYNYCYDRNNFDNLPTSSQLFYKLFFTFLSTENRLNITAPIFYSNIQDNFSFNIMERLYTNENEIKKLNRFLLDSFEKAIDISEEPIQNTCAKKYKIGNEIEIESTISSNRRTAMQNLKNLEDLHNQGDGIRSAVGILASLIVNEHSIALIDEPESFLHPPQARILGNNIAELSDKKQCFISTHNIDLIRGILEKKSSRVKIIKIDRKSNSNEFHLLDNDSIVKIANDKNLKYTNILNGLFYNKVVLCENENDCKFYSAILETLDGKIYQNTLFCAVGGKDQFKVIIPLLKKLQISYLIIADMDLIDDKNRLRQLLNSIEDNKYDEISNIHKKFLEEFESDKSLVKEQSTIKKEINKVFTNEKYMSLQAADKIKDILKNINSLKLLKEGGISVIPSGECRKKFDKIKHILNENNIFILECGEMERLIPQEEGHGGAWVEKVLKEYPDINDNIYDAARDFIRKAFNISNNN